MDCNVVRDCIDMPNNLSAHLVQSQMIAGRRFREGYSVANATL